MGLKQGCPAGSPLFTVVHAFLIQVMHRLSGLTCPAPVSFTPLSPLFPSPRTESSHTYMAPHSEYVDDF
eukprot:6086825-Prorocentrum_lima.AAC.1